MEVTYKPSFIYQYKKLSPALQDETNEKIELFRDPKNHTALKVHKLKGELSGYWSFSVNYKYRIIFMWETAGKSAICLAIGDHAVYE